MTLYDLITPQTWIISDTHWEHPRIGAYQNRPENHFVLMRERWMERVQPDDVVFHLGDLVCFGDRKRHPYWVSGLPGQKFLILGNHDYHSESWYEAFGFTVVGRGNKPYWWVSPTGVLVAFSHEPLVLQEHAGWDVNIHGHVHSNTHRDWTPITNGMYRNVSVEATDYAPIRLGEILSAERKL